MHKRNVLIDQGENAHSVSFQPGAICALPIDKPAALLLKHITAQVATKWLNLPLRPTTAVRLPITALGEYVRPNPLNLVHYRQKYQSFY